MDVVPGVGFEPTCPFGQQLLRLPCMPIPPPGPNTKDTCRRVRILLRYAQPREHSAWVEQPLLDEGPREMALGLGLRERLHLEQAFGPFTGNDRFLWAQQLREPASEIRFAV